MDDLDFTILQNGCEKHYGIRFAESLGFDYGVKGIIARRDFTFIRNLSNAYKAFLTLHALGYYHCICRMRDLGVTRYDFLYRNFDRRTFMLYLDPARRSHLLSAYARRNRSEVADLIGAEQDRPETMQETLERICILEHGANQYARAIADALDAPALRSVIDRAEGPALRYVMDICLEGRKAVLNSEIEFVERYLAGPADISVPGDPDGIFDRAGFELGKVDWALVDAMMLEWHFF
ncbi:hypothetical protein [Sphingobium sp.]|uniref:hypothetical protein n=1 Tax=Sphingobium sp. TaxID=1912891 RepID=UPI0028BECA76|nr:hypothetical protein [Sphingobium sp.]